MVQDSLNTLLINRAGHSLASRAKLFEKAWPQLEAMARRLFPGRQDRVWGPVALINEVWLRLYDRRDDEAQPVQFKNRQHFFAYWKRALTHTNIDAHRKAGREADWQEVGPDARDAGACDVCADLLREELFEGFADALAELQQVNALVAESFRVRFNRLIPQGDGPAGEALLTFEETGLKLNLNPYHARKNWFTAVAFIRRRLVERGLMERGDE